MQSILFVCLGNICRSPTAEGVFRVLAEQQNRAYCIDSAGTGNWHAGEPPHPPSVKAAKRRGYDISGQRARQVRREDFNDFDLILAMDRNNLADLRAIMPPDATAELGLFLDYAPELKRKDVPDPWYTGEFDLVIDLIEAASRGLLSKLR